MDNSQKLSESIEKYLHWKSTYTTRAATNYRIWLVRLNALVGDKNLNEVTLEHISKFRDQLDKKYQPYTIQLAFVAIHNFFGFWNVQGFKCLAPTLIRVPRTVARRKAVVSEEDFALMCEDFKGKNQFFQIRNFLIIRMLWDTGVRISELCDMNYEEIDFTKREVLVRTRKSDRMRQVFWSPETHGLLKRYVDLRKNLSHAPALFLGINKDGMTSRLRQRTIQKIIDKLVTELKIGKRITPHSFRHGKAHKILRMGGNPKHVQAILGHSETNPYAAFHYLQLDNAELRIEAKRFLQDPVKESG